MVKIKFRDYKNYPPEILNAAHFRDEYDDLPDGAFFAIAEEQDLTDALVEMAEWENENTNEVENE
jgi:hypothetical protein